MTNALRRTIYPGQVDFTRCTIGYQDHPMEAEFSFNSLPTDINPKLCETLNG